MSSQKPRSVASASAIEEARQPGLWAAWAKKRLNSRSGQPPHPLPAAASYLPHPVQGVVLESGYSLAEFEALTDVESSVSYMHRCKKTLALKT